MDLAEDPQTLPKMHFAVTAKSVLWLSPQGAPNLVLISQIAQSLQNKHLSRSDARVTWQRGPDLLSDCRLRGETYWIPTVSSCREVSQTYCKPPPALIFSP